MYDIIIPSCKSYEDVNILASLIKQYDPDGNEYNYIPTGFSTSASVNRNYGLLQSFKTDNEIIIMIDDDIGGFFPGWQDVLCDPFKEDPNILICSARLITPDGMLSPMMGADFRIDKPISSVDKAILSAAIAFRKKDVIGLTFCMNMIGSGWEDTLFCRMLTKKIPEGRFVVVNTCQLIHYHEMKKQTEAFEYNYRVYLSELKKEGMHE